MKLDLTQTKLQGTDLEIAQGILKRNGELYASRPTKASGMSQYVWRMVAFSLSDRPAHQCIPVTADFHMTNEEYWDKTWDEKVAIRERLDAITKQIVDTVPVTEQPGTLRWARAFGVI